LNHPAVNDENEEIEAVTKSNVASRRLWLGLKYWQSEPVLSKMSMVSKPTRRIHIDVESLRDVVRGRKRGYVEGLRSPGECLFLSTDQGIMEARQCVETKTGGLVLCRTA
jgi:ribosomal protein S8